MGKYLVSIITPMYNSENFIIQAIESVLSQTYANWELLIIDDNSNDSSVEIVKKYSKQDQRIKYFLNIEDSGAANCRNIAISKANGKYLAFLDSDDIWKKNKLEYQINFMTEKNISFSYTSFQKIDLDGNIINEIIKAPAIMNYRKLLLFNWIGNSTVIYDSNILGKVYSPIIAKRNDYALWLKILRTSNIKGCGIEKILTYYRVGHQSLSKNKLTLMKYQWEVFRKIEELSLINSIYHFIMWIILKSVFKIKMKIIK